MARTPINWIPLSSSRFASFFYFFFAHFRTNRKTLSEHSRMARTFSDATSFIRSFVNFAMRETNQTSTISLSSSHSHLNRCHRWSVPAKTGHRRAQRRRQWKCISGFYGLRWCAKSMQKSQVALEQLAFALERNTHGSMTRSTFGMKKNWFLRRLSSLDSAFLCRFSVRSSSLWTVICSI